MTTKTDTKAKTPAAALPLSYAAATGLRVTADEAAAAAAGAVTTAIKHEASLRARLADGDTTVSAAALVAATGDIERCELLAQGSRAALRGARETEAPLCAEHWSALLADVLAGDELADAADAAASAIATALEALADVAAQQSATVRRAVADAKAAGLGSGSPYRVALVSQGNREGLTLDGGRIWPVAMTDTLTGALKAGAAGAGWLLDGEGANALRLTPINH